MARTGASLPGAFTSFSEYDMIDGKKVPEAAEEQQQNTLRELAEMDEVDYQPTTPFGGRACLGKCPFPHHLPNVLVTLALEGVSRCAGPAPSKRSGQGRFCASSLIPPSGGDGDLRIKLGNQRGLQVVASKDSDGDALAADLTRVFAGCVLQIWISASTS